MKAIERIKRYGIKKYIKTCLHKEPTPELIEKYKKKYGEKIPIEKPERYQVTLWDVTMKDERTGEQVELKSLQSKLHKIHNLERDLNEVERRAQGRLGGSNWFLIDAEYRGRKFYWIKTDKEKEEKPEKPEKKLISREQIREIAEGLKMAGLTPEEIGRAIKEILK